MQEEGISCSSISSAVDQKMFFNNWELFGESSKQKKNQTKKKMVIWQGERFIDKHCFFVMGKGDREGKACSFKKKIEYYLETIQ